ncbi:protein of unknown function DUF1256 [Alkaliphilus metalliredigens QYMF]|uniref:Sporulation protein YyaC n=1 Tax=Alkaliphilus metalliredigens (strain QYMF) TaxID=293826 RepID=A6TXD3_ALKMQ|nr:spore protease YyaC [Alkaliphilus metalliredigens]ABR50851.1 protein of unknown function DUF1256 [Alkaliphilus metalliredigens QYMF]
MGFFNKQTPDSVSVETPVSSVEFSHLLTQYLQKYYHPPFQELVFLCIGTDRSTGDALGPLIGYKLCRSLRHYDSVHVLGTLEDPVHAKNLKERIHWIYETYHRPFVVAIDACLGKVDRIGYMTVSNGPLKPGAGVNKELPAVGDIHITGIVNMGGYMEYLILQNTRLNLVMKMADTITESIKYSLWTLNKNNTFSSLMKKENLH